MTTRVRTISAVPPRQRAAVAAPRWMPVVSAEKADLYGSDDSRRELHP
ncbi:hypothetical protein DEJ34_15420 [Curtobacterium sp. MCPF17_050]|nr:MULTISPECIES: hypothetical protein [unclassified Curtobacterium]WIB15506.1 hypothetical protein DEJ34_15420 [Curtobacterium sp. MCPF17_050]